MYICNLFTQPGETDDFTVRDHIDFLEKYSGKGSIDAVSYTHLDVYKRQ